MSQLGLIVNPRSGRDIRRLVSHAIVVDNQEKMNTAKRIILSAISMGVERILIMPDRHRFAEALVHDCTVRQKLVQPDRLKILDFFAEDSALDTERFALAAEAAGAKALVALGGDGTCRAVAKSGMKLPFLPVSTGTNNVYPRMWEGTVVGIAAAAVALGYAGVCSAPSKQIEVTRNGRDKDIALIDAVVTPAWFQGSKAVWEMDQIQRIFVTQCSPASIGFSSIPGSVCPVSEADDYGLTVEISQGTPTHRAAAAAGQIAVLALCAHTKLPLHQPYELSAEHKGMLALDGEREFAFAPGDKLCFEITRNGPNKVDIEQAVLAAQQSGFFQLKNSSNA